MQRIMRGLSNSTLASQGVGAMISLEPIQFRTGKDVVKPQRTRSIPHENAVESINQAAPYPAARNGLVAGSRATAASQLKSTACRF
jgi:hypothetical protein